MICLQKSSIKSIILYLFYNFFCPLFHNLLHNFINIERFFHHSLFPLSPFPFAFHCGHNSDDPG